MADLAQSQELYRRLPDLAHFIHLQEAQGEDPSGEQGDLGFEHTQGRIGIF